MACVCASVACASEGYKQIRAQTILTRSYIRHFIVKQIFHRILDFFYS